MFKTGAIIKFDKKENKEICLNLIAINGIVIAVTKIVEPRVKRQNLARRVRHFNESLLFFIT